MFFNKISVLLYIALESDDNVDSSVTSELESGDDFGQGIFLLNLT